MYKQAEKVAKDREAAYYQRLSKDKDGQFYLNMLKQGTISDKISALSMIIQREPENAIPYMQSLLNLAKKKNRKQAELAVGALKDLFTQNLLKDGHKLMPFSKNPLVTMDVSRAYFEHQLKECYNEFITGVLKPMTHDDMDFLRKFALNTMESLIELKPE